MSAAPTAISEGFLQEDGDFRADEPLLPCSSSASNITSAIREELEGVVEANAAVMPVSNSVSTFSVDERDFVEEESEDESSEEESVQEKPAMRRVLSVQKPVSSGKNPVVDVEPQSDDHEDPYSKDDEQADAEDNVPEVVIVPTELCVDAAGNTIDDVANFIAMYNGNDPALKVVVCEQLYLALQFIAADAVQKGNKTNLYHVYEKVAERMQKIIDNIHVYDTHNLVRKVVAKLPGKTIPTGVKTLFSAEKAKGATVCFIRDNKKHVKRDLFLETDENGRSEGDALLDNAAYGKRVWERAIEQRKLMASYCNPYYTHPSNLPSGATPLGNYFYTRRQCWEWSKGAKVSKALSNAKQYASKTDKEDKTLLIVKQEQALTKYKAKSFDPNWYPIYWLSYLVLGLPASDKALAFLLPFDPEEIALRDKQANQKQASTKISEGTSSSDYKSAPHGKLSSGRSTPAKEDPKTIHMKHEKIFPPVFLEHLQLEIDEKKRKNNFDQNFDEYTRIKLMYEGAIAMAEKAGKEDRVKELAAEALEQMMLHVPKKR